jgi:hypothetical protein
LGNRTDGTVWLGIHFIASFGTQTVHHSWNSAPPTKVPKA